MTTDTFGPDFIGIGAQRSGTSWVYNCLLDHPEVFLPQKEVHFFDNKYDQGVDWYTGLFAAKGDKSVCGEFTPDYMFHPECLQRIKDYKPDVKLIIVLREPLQRALSAYNLYRSHGRYNQQDFNNAVAEDPFLIKQSKYFHQLKNVFSLFPEEQVFVSIYDDIENDPESFIQSLYDFLGIDTRFVPDELHRKRNTSAFSSSQRLLNLPAIQNRLEKSILKTPFIWFKSTRLFLSLKNWLINLDKKQTEKTQISPSITRELLSDIHELEKLTGLDLTRWEKKLKDNE
jgi:hypothetical protein